MKVDEVKVLMYGMSCSSTLARPPCITQYGAYERDDWWSPLWLVHQGGEGGGGAARGGGDEEEMKRVVRADPWRPSTPKPVAPLPLCLFNYFHHLYHLHVQNGYAYASPPSSPISASRPILAQFEDPQV